MMKKFWKIGFYILITFVSVVFALIIISIIPIPGNYKVLTVLSGSMEPTIKTGSIVFVKPSSNYQVNDIITFSESNISDKPITHRIIEVKEDNGLFYYKVKGDANSAADWSEVSKENITGKVLFSIPFLGYLLSFAKEPLGFFLLIWAPAIIIIWEEIGKIRKELKTAPKNLVSPIAKVVQTTPSKVNLDIKPKETKIENKKLRSDKTMRKPRKKKNPPKKI